MTNSMVDKKDVSDSSYDVAIVGGGMVGLSFALALARENDDIRIVILESHTVNSSGALYQSSFDARSTAISSDSVRIFQKMGLWPNLNQNISPITRVHVSDKGHVGQVSYTQNDNQGQALGFVIENAWLGRVLIDAVQATANIKVRAPADVTGIRMRKNGAQLTLASDPNSTLHARLLVAADGGDSKLRKYLGIACDIHDYGQTAVTTNVEFEKPHHGVAFERFTNKGPLALLPLNTVGAKKVAEHNRSALVWTHATNDVEKYLHCNDAEFIAALQQRFGYRLGRIRRIGERQYYPLKKLIAKEQVRTSLVLMGNAAHYLHPVAGQGFNLALRDAECLAEVIVRALTCGEDFASIRCLQSYVTKQASDQLSTTGASHLFNILFTNDSLTAAALRNFGLVGLNVLPSARKVFFDQMMGRGKKQLPRL